MSYWQQVQFAGGMGGYYHWVLLSAILTALVLQVLLPSAAARLRRTAVLAILSFPGVLLCALLLYRGVSPDSLGYRWLHFAANWMLAVALINLVGVLVFRAILPALRLQAPPILRDTILGIAFIAVAIALLSQHIVNLSGIIATSAVMTAVIGFSLQDTLGNIMGGVALQMEQSIAVGDWVRIGEVEGVVHEIRWRQTSVQTRNWDTVVIPNSLLMKSQVTVLGRRAGKPRLHRMIIPFNVDYRHSPVDVIGGVQDALRAQPITNVATEPLPTCELADFKDSFGSYLVKYWIVDLHADGSTNSEVRIRISIALMRMGISIPIPAQTVFMTINGRARQERKGEQEIRERLGALRQISILQPLTDDVRREIAEHLTPAPFRKGEVMTRQGNIAHYLYIVVKGDGEVRYDAGNGIVKTVGTMRAGDVFGEMGLMTGEPRSATVVATSDCLCYKLDRAGFADAIQRRPALAEEISKLLAQRKLELDAAKAGIPQSTSPQHLSETQGELLRKIRGFFRLE